ncbi:hypothetical protein P9057_12430 [Gallibacterium anatis]|uniref:hypothetical protein n=1 Tax=Gallibacterium TaxID=155493 RepID=UPI000A7DE572|nr:MULTISPECIES: hypothetical protein [Gallibacterium]WKS98176.1 hypothetical protein NYR19_05205 [Gallibacterium anatis]
MQNYEILSARKSQVEAALSSTTNPEESTKLHGKTLVERHYTLQWQIRIGIIASYIRVK